VDDVATPADQAADEPGPSSAGRAKKPNVTTTWSPLPRMLAGRIDSSDGRVNASAAGGATSARAKLSTT
jgi:hypothetical protein